MSAWTKVRLGDVLRTIERPVVLDPLGEYRLLGARWYAGGLFVKDVKLGQEIAAAKLYMVREGDFVYNRLFAWKGSFAVAGAEADGCFVSNEFPCFECDSDKADVNFLRLWFSQESSWLSALGLSSGATPTSRNRLKEAAFLSLEVPLPPLAKQRAVAAWVEDMDKRIREVKRLKQESFAEREMLCRALVASCREMTLVPMSELVTLRPPDVVVRPDVTYQFAGVYSFGRGVFRGGEKAGVEFAYPKLSTIRTGDFIYPKLMAWEGALGVVPPECDGCVVSTEFPVFTVNEDRVLPEVLAVHFRNPVVWPGLSGSSTGTNVRRRRLNPQEFLRYRMPVPSKRIQEQLRQVMNSLDGISSLAHSATVEIDALLPSILARAFHS